MIELLLVFAELVFYFSLLLSVIFALVLGYHWYQYGTKKRHAATAVITFSVGATLFLAVMAFSLIYVG